MQAKVDGQVIADSTDITECAGYAYFPQASVRMDWLAKVEKTAKDHPSRRSPAASVSGKTSPSAERTNQAVWRPS